MRKVLLPTLLVGLVLSIFACGGEEYKCEECGEVFDNENALEEHILDVHGETAATEPTEETPDLAAIEKEFKAVFDDVNEYMETHNQSNTGAEELSTAYGDFAESFAEMKKEYETAKPAETDKTRYDKLIGLMDKASTSMSKYSEGIAKGVPNGIELSLGGATLWDEVKQEFAGAV